MTTTFDPPDIGDRVRVSVYNFRTGRIADWDGIVTARLTDTLLVVINDDDRKEYQVPLRHVHPHTTPAIAGA